MTAENLQEERALGLALLAGYRHYVSERYPITAIDPHSVFSELVDAASPAHDEPIHRVFGRLGYVQGILRARGIFQTHDFDIHFSRGEVLPPMSEHP